jgi:MFS family permease
MQDVTSTVENLELLTESGLTRQQWLVFFVTSALWMCDGYETYALLLTISPSLHELLPPANLHNIPQFAGYLISLTLFGWAIGGVIGGFVGDRIGRRYTMIISVVLYSVFTGTSALAQNWQILALSRFLTGIGLGAEWGVGASLLQEVWPQKWRTKAAGVLQAAFSGGFVVASCFWLLIGGVFDASWRWLYIVGVTPAVLIALTARFIPESEPWKRAKGLQKAIATTLRANSRNLIVAVIVSSSITIGFWAISSWVPTYVAILVHGRQNAVSYAGWAGLLFAIGEMFACSSFGWIAEIWGRRLTLAIFLVGSFLITPFLFLVVKDALFFVLLQIPNGFFTGGIYGWYAVHPPELFPTRIRSTAISIIFNSARFLAMLGPILSSNLIAFFGGYGPAATIASGIFLLGVVAVFFLPETKGLPLPE